MKITKLGKIWPYNAKFNHISEERILPSVVFLMTQLQLSTTISIKIDCTKESGANSLPRTAILLRPINSILITHRYLTKKNNF